MPKVHASYAEIGPTLLLVNPKRDLETPENVEALIWLLNDAPYYTINNTKEEIRKFSKHIAGGPGLFGLTRWDWEDWKQVGRGDPLTYVPFSHVDLAKFGAVNDPDFRWQTGQKIYALKFARFGTRMLGPFPDHIPERTRFLLQKWKNAVDVLEPEFAIVDDLGHKMLAHEGEDLRGIAWGATIYGPELVRRIGRDKLLSSPAWQVEELSWGGVWVQADENPFKVDLVTKRSIEDHLNLKNLFPPGASKSMNRRSTAVGSKKSEA